MLIDKENFKEAYLVKVQTMYGKSIDEASFNDKYAALGSLIRDYIHPNWAKTNRQYGDKGEKELYYFSIEFLLGKLLETNLLNMGLSSVCTEALAELGIDMNELLREEPDAGLGNGGLGRLAACFLDSMASLSLPGHGCGIRYKYGLFEQKVVNNNQVEVPDNWLKDGYIWECRKPSKTVEVRFGGNIVYSAEPDGTVRYSHEHYDTVLAVPYDIPILGYQNSTVNTLRLWSAEMPESDLNFASFNRSDYLRAVEYKHSVERISKIPPRWRVLSARCQGHNRSSGRWTRWP